ncbi:MAG: gliding motility protein GldN [Muribaculaceae bacterium]|nr:gliding motility protein GldN [Muribaculaceae bacterium]
MMQKIYKKVLIGACAGIIAGTAFAQVETGGAVMRRSERDKKKNTEKTVGVTERMQSFYEQKDPHDADLSYMREIYRDLDLTKAENTPLYYPEDLVDGRENLLRVIMGAVVDGRIPAYEYLDGREIFTDQYKVNVGEMLDRFGIYYTEEKGSTEKNPKYHIEEADMPTGQVLNYYIIEKWEFDRRSNRMKTRVEAICPVMTRSGDFGGEAKYPMFWVKFDALRPFLAHQYVFISDDNNLPQYSLDDYFTMGMYDGEIYKTRNLRNLSMAQMYPDEDMRKHAQDSIDNRLKNYGKDLWVPTREEYLAQKEREEEIAKALAAGDSIPGRTMVAEETPAKTTSARTKKRTSTAKKSRTSRVKSSTSSNQPNSQATKSVRRRKR